MIVTNETIMPDGRLFYAWKNELDLLRSKEPEIREKQKELHDLFRLFRVLEIKKEELPESDHIIIKIARSDIVMNQDFRYYPEKYCEISSA